MSPQVNRWTGEPHRHERERERRARQTRSVLLRDLALAELARASAGLFFEDYDAEALALRLEQLRARNPVLSPSG